MRFSKQLRIRQIGSLHVAIHASSDWKNGRGISEKDVADGAFPRQSVCVGGGGGGGDWANQRLSRWANINPALGQSLVFAGMAQ